LPLERLNSVILAGGKSSRMGEDKALMSFGGFDSMAEYQYCKLKKIFKNVYISIKESKFNFEHKAILDKQTTSSPMVALCSVLEELQEDFFLISVDIPLISKNSIKKLLNLYNVKQGYEIYLLKSPNGLEPTVAIYTKRVLPKVKELLTQDIHKLNYLIKNSNYTVLNSDNLDEFINVNDKKAYLKANTMSNEFDYPTNQ